MVEDNKLSKEAKHALNLGLQVLEHAMEVAADNEDLEAMIAISDRLMLLYQHLSDKNSAGNILFQNGLWIIRRQAIVQAKESNIGLQPFPWFGNKIRYLEQDPRLQEVDDVYQIRLL